MEIYNKKNPYSEKQVFHQKGGRIMGKVRTVVVKNYANMLLEKFPDYFKKDFEHNKKVLDEIAVIKSKKLKNQIAGYITHLLDIREAEVST